MNHQSLERLELTGFLLMQTVMDKVQVGRGIAAAMQPYPHRYRRLVAAEDEAFRNFDPIGLWRTIDLRLETDDEGTAPLQPRKPLIF
ncbi:MAG: hypothetical protein ACK53L_30010, partial [Pirellulaceae bacterium]